MLGDLFRYKLEVSCILNVLTKFWEVWMRISDFMSIFILSRVLVKFRYVSILLCKIHVCKLNILSQLFFFRDFRHYPAIIIGLESPSDDRHT